MECELVEVWYKYSHQTGTRLVSYWHNYWYKTGTKLVQEWYKYWYKYWFKTGSIDRSIDQLIN